LTTFLAMAFLLALRRGWSEPFTDQPPKGVKRAVEMHRQFA
jgi:hypothetical protein